MILQVMEMCEKVEHVVVDSGAFIKNASIQTIGENIYTLSEVVSEIRDRATRERLQVLPYTLQFREPSVESIRVVTEFSKKTGDYRTLSAVDLKVIALTYQLEKEFVGTEHIREIPQKKAEIITARKLLENPAEIAGFYLDKKDRKTEPENSSKLDQSVNTSFGNTAAENTNIKDVVLKPLQELVLGDNERECQSSQGQISEFRDQSSQDEISSGLNLHASENQTSEENCTETEAGQCVEKDAEKLSENVTSETKSEISSSSWPAEGDMLDSELLEEGEDTDDGEDDDDSDDDDDGGWITPSNIQSMKEKLGDVNIEKATVTVGCLTTDFSMQNVMIQMGLNVVSVNGMLIKRARSYALRCFACMKVTSNLTKDFCPKCGNNTLQKVSMTVDQDGCVKYFLSKRKPVTTRGLRYSLPAPKGGKHGNNPILFEDQPCPQQREAKKTQQNQNVFDPDYIANQSPFALNDTTSRAAQLGIRQKGAWNKRNPNVGKKRSGRRK